MGKEEWRRIKEGPTFTEYGMFNLIIERSFLLVPTTIPFDHSLLLVSNYCTYKNHSSSLDVVYIVPQILHSSLHALHRSNGDHSMRRKRVSCVLVFLWTSFEFLVVSVQSFVTVQSLFSRFVYYLFRLFNEFLWLRTVMLKLSSTHNNDTKINLKQNQLK